MQPSLFGHFLIQCYLISVCVKCGGTGKRWVGGGFLALLDPKKMCGNDINST